MFEKKKILAEIIATMRQQLVVHEAMYNEAVDASLKADGRMQSRYDTQKMENEYLASSRAQQIDSLVNSIAALEKMALPITNNQIGCGSVVTVEEKNTTQTKRDYFLLPTLAVGTEDIVAKYNFLPLSMASPLGQLLLGRQAGEKVTLSRALDTVVLEIKQIA